MPEYSVADYLLDRLAEVGVRHLFGVPGDFTLRFLDHVEAHPLVEWVGCANELGAGYAADGYARLAGVGALSTTFGVGELSALSAVAGAFAEHVPVVHVVGAPTNAVRESRRATHHTLGDGDFEHFERMSAEVTAAQAVLSAETAAHDIDRVLGIARERARPVYLVLPADVVDAPVSPPGAPLPARRPTTEPEALAGFRQAVAGRLAEARSVAVLADILVQRLGALSQLHRLLETGVPHATLLWGRRVVDEAAPSYLGSYLGAASDPAVRAAIEEADLLVVAGVQFTDLTTGFFSQHLPADGLVEIGGGLTRVGGREFGPIAMSDALDAVTEALAGRRFDTEAPQVLRFEVHRIEHGPGDSAGALDQRALWDRVTRFLRAGDVVVADQGTAFYGMADERLPHGVTFVGQPLWAAIGYTLPAILGAALADRDRRPILLIGDGAAQLTIAELGTLLRQRIPAIVVIVDNAGYTIERVIHGPDASYNDIARWQWAALVRALGGRAGVDVGVAVRSAAELEAELAAARARDGLTLIQAVVPQGDVPPVLRALAAEAARATRAPVSGPRA